MKDSAEVPSGLWTLAGLLFLLLFAVWSCGHGRDDYTLQYFSSQLLC